MIKTSRKRQNLTQKELAIRCNLSQSFLSELENKQIKKNITLRQIIKIAQALKLNPCELSCWFINKELNKVEFAEELGVFKVG
ncbi:helix-turn-helix domain-containing protein [Terrisporobacter petrolearius]|uniref:helix-turn-helix domain-containing protein n=1 Tax=Terrisporobacter petrolearius TaxID=1460447 RepID=UPI003367BA95